MSKAVETHEDFVLILVQFALAFPDEEAITSHMHKLSQIWRNEENEINPIAMLELTAFIAGSKAQASRQGTFEYRQNACVAVLSKIQTSHDRSGSKKTLSYAKKHLCAQGRKQHNPDSPTFWYQSLLGSISSKWLSTYVILPKKRKRADTSLTINKQTRKMDACESGYPCKMTFRYWNVYKSVMMALTKGLPPGIPRCLLVDANSMKPRKKQKKEKDILELAHLDFSEFSRFTFTEDAISECSPTDAPLTKLTLEGIVQRLFGIMENLEAMEPTEYVNAGSLLQECRAAYDFSKRLWDSSNAWYLEFKCPECD